MQTVIAALIAAGNGIGDALPLFLPADVVALAAHECDELIFCVRVSHAVVNGVHQPELPALASGGGVVLGGGHGFHLFLHLPLLKYRQSELHTHRVVAPAQFH